MWGTFGNAGSRATPSNPRSQELSTFTVTNGLSRRTSSLTTRSAPVCSHTNTRPSGATAIAVAPVRPVATTSSANPSGKSAIPDLDAGALERFGGCADRDVCKPANDPWSDQQTSRTKAQISECRIAGSCSLFEGRCACGAIAAEGRRPSHRGSDVLSHATGGHPRFALCFRTTFRSSGPPPRCLETNSQPEMAAAREPTRHNDAV